MRERLALLDGRLEIQSARGRGTRVVVVVPLPPEATGVANAVAAG
jgi:two-component system sensor histidine kinase DesK